MSPSPSPWRTSSISSRWPSPACRPLPMIGAERLSTTPPRRAQYRCRRTAGAGPPARCIRSRSPRPPESRAHVHATGRDGNIMPPVFQSERFFREAWPQISQAFESPMDAASEVQWITGLAVLEPPARVLDAPCGFGRHSVELARLGFAVTGVDFSETEFGRAVNLFSSIGFFSDDEDRLLLDRFWRALKPGGLFVLDTRNRDQLVRSLPPEERKRVSGWTLRVENAFDPATSRWRARWFRLKRATAKTKETAQELIGESEIRLYSAHELSAMLRPERWSRVELYGGLDGTPFSLDAPRLVLAAWK